MVLTNKAKRWHNHDENRDRDFTAKAMTGVTLAMGQGKAKEQALQRWSRQRPCWADGVEWQNREGVVIIKVRRRDWLGRLMRWLTARDVRRQIELDEIASFVWSLCDGQHTVADIAEALMQRYQLLRREAMASLMEFLVQLHRRGLVRWEEAMSE